MPESRSPNSAAEAEETEPAPAASHGRRRWTINGDFVSLQETGVARYARETVRALDTLVGEGHPLTRDLELDLVSARPLELAHVPVRVVPEFRSPRLPQVWAQLQLPRQVPAGLVSLCNLAPAFHRRHIVCIHDLLTFQQPQSYSRGFVLAHRLILPRLGLNARFITTVSTLSRDHIVAHGVAPADKVVVTYNGADHALRWRPEAATLDPAGAGRPFVLCLARSQGYKNTGLMLKVAVPLAAHGIDVVLAGDVRRDELETQYGPLPGNVRLLGRISDDTLALAYRKALAFLFPSRMEGFGLPAVEAMTLGCPLVASEAPCLPEVCGDGALYADPDLVEPWAEAVLRIAGDAPFTRALVERGRARARLYSWRRIAEAYLELMQRADAPQAAPQRGAGNSRSQ